jgi:hypothetical protein
MAYFSKMPTVMATHWGFHGEPNGYSSRFWGVFTPSIFGSVITIIFFIADELRVRGKVKFISDPLGRQIGPYAVPIICSVLWIILLTGQYDILKSNL